MVETETDFWLWSIDNIIKSFKTANISDWLVDMPVYQLYCFLIMGIWVSQLRILPAFEVACMSAVVMHMNGDLGCTGLETIWVNDINHAPGTGSITQTIAPQSGALPMMQCRMKQHILHIYCHMITIGKYQNKCSILVWNDTNSAKNVRAHGLKLATCWHPKELSQCRESTEMIGKCNRVHQHSLLWEKFCMKWGALPISSDYTNVHGCRAKLYVPKCK